MKYLRQPIVSVLGHVDSGKTQLLDFIRNSKILQKEAGGITQHIGATEVPKEDLISLIENFVLEEKIKIPGILFIDTPGHKAFTSLRKRGGSICDIGILVVDCMEGFKPQTIEAVEILKSTKTPFVIAANKIDMLLSPHPENLSNLQAILDSQGEEVERRFEEKIYKIVGELSEFEYNSNRYDRIDDFTKNIAVVPISAKFGWGICELLSTLVGLTQKYLENKLTIENETFSRGIILEVKNYKGFGTTYDVIVYDGVLNLEDTLLVLDVDKVQMSRIKSILRPSKLKEIRDSQTKFTSLKSVQAACGIRLSAPNFKKVHAGMPIISLSKLATEEDIRHAEDELLAQSAQIFIEHKQNGVLIKADTLGSLEALAHILEEHKIPLRVSKIGKVGKHDVIDASCDVEKYPKNALILNFSQEVDEKTLDLAKKYGITIISNDVIYKLVEDAKVWIEEKEKDILKRTLKSLTLPFRIDILPNCVFRKSNPAIVGVEVKLGVAKVQTKLINGEGRLVGTLRTIKDKDESLKELLCGEQAACGIEGLTIGRGAEEHSNLYSYFSEEEFRTLKRNISLLSSEQKACLREITSIMRKENSLWGI